MTSARYLRILTTEEKKALDLSSLVYRIKDSLIRPNFEEKVDFVEVSSLLRDIGHYMQYLAHKVLLEIQ
jgi:hypothetical protein